MTLVIYAAVAAAAAWGLLALSGCAPSHDLDGEQLAVPPYVQSVETPQTVQEEVQK
jgi:hypothetical protein